MAQQHVATYLNDHLAGAVAALELLEHLEGVHAGTPLAALLSGLRSDIQSDRQELEALMGRLKVTASAPRRAAAWLGEKVSQLKLRLDDRAGGPLHLLEALDALSVGIEGKRLLWRALAAAGGPAISLADCERLQKRAEEQRAVVEAARLDAAREALGPTPSPVTQGG